MEAISPELAVYIWLDSKNDTFRCLSFDFSSGKGGGSFEFYSSDQLG